MITWLEGIGIHGWPHLAQVIVLSIGWVWAICWVVPACIRDTKELWEELEKEEASLMETAEATEKSLSISSVSCDTGDVKEEAR